MTGAGLEGVQETLLIPLAARAVAPRLFPQLGFRDPVAEELARTLGADAERFADDLKSMRGTVLRVQWFDAVARDFLKQNPDGLCVSLGSGLDTRPQRLATHGVKGHGAQWIDIDVPQVAALRQRLIPAQPGVTTVGADITNLGWIDDLPWRHGQPALVMAEGVTMYLSTEAVESLVQALVTAAAGKNALLELAFDYASPLMAANARRHPSVSRTGARFDWSLKRPQDILALAPGLQMVEHGEIMSRSGPASATVEFLHRLFTGGRSFHGMARYRLQPQS